MMTDTVTKKAMALVVKDRSAQEDLQVKLAIKQLDELDAKVKAARVVHDSPTGAFLDALGITKKRGAGPGRGSVEEAHAWGLEPPSVDLPPKTEYDKPSRIKTAARSVKPEASPSR